MKILCYQSIFFFALVIFAISIPAFSQEENETSSMDLSMFEIIFERNIFNPDRQKPEEVPDPEPIVETPQRDELVLVGTLVTETDTYAFFDGSLPSYQCVLTAGDVIADCTVTAITVSNVSLKTKDHILALKVGKLLTREEGGPWTISDQIRPTSLARSDSETTSSENEGENTEASSESTSSDTMSNDDLLKRLMERREQELGQ